MISLLPYFLSLISASFAPTTAVPIRIGLANRGVSFRWLIRDVYTELLQAIAHANLPLFRIVEVFRPERSDTHNALFQTIIQLLPRMELDVAGAMNSNATRGRCSCTVDAPFLGVMLSTRVAQLMRCPSRKRSTYSTPAT